MLDFKMTNKSDLTIDDKYFDELSKEFRSDSDRATAVLIGAEIDNVLLNIMKKVLGKENKNSVDLFGSMQPLSSFSSRIEMLFRLGIIDEEKHHDLHILRKIRNGFAHGRKGLKFNSPGILKLLNKLQVLDRMKKEGAELARIEAFEVPRQRFELFACYLIGYLSSREGRLNESYDEI